MPPALKWRRPFAGLCWSLVLFTGLFAGALKLSEAAESAKEKEPEEEPAQAPEGEEVPDEGKA